MGDRPRSAVGSRRRAAGDIPTLLLVTLVSAGGVALVIRELAQHSSAATLVVLGIFALFFVTTLPLLAIPVRRGRSNLSVNWHEVAVMLGLAAAPTSRLLPAAAIAVLAANLCLRRQVRKALYNAALTAFGLLAASAVVSALLHGRPDDPSGRTFAALAAAALVFFLVVETGVLTVIGVSQRSLPVQIVQRSLGLSLLSLLTNIAFGSGILLLWHYSRPSVVLLVPVMLLVTVLHRQYLSASHERDVWKQLDAASRELSSLSERRVIDAATRRAAQLFGADHAEVELADVGPVFGRPPIVKISYPRVTTNGAQTVVETDLPGAPDGPLGVLRLRFDGAARMSLRDHQVMTTFAHSVGSTLLNARLHEQMRALAERKAYEAAHDPLTGLANRALLLEEGQRLLARAGTDEVCALLIIDLDHFKQVNDTLGHAAGDALLCRVAERLRARVRDDDLVARLGGDEFAVLLAALPHAEAAQSRAEILLTGLRQTLDFEGLHIAVQASIGLACSPEDGSSVDELLRRADVALYQAKRDRDAWRRYQRSNDEVDPTRLSLMAELREALRRDELVLYYQPQVDLTEQRTLALEALVRWRHPRRGTLMPAEFVPVAEQSGLVRDLTTYLLDRALATLAGWRAEGLTDVKVSVNLSARNLLDARLPEVVDELVARHGVPAGQLVLEITETSMMGEPDAVHQVLTRLRDVGVELSVDDFGTGYSSLTFLQRVTVNEVKIDSGFVRQMLVSPGDLAIVRATTELAHGLGLRVVAEGVEDGDLLAALVDLGCDMAQGFHLCSPLPAEAVVPRLRDEARAQAARRAAEPVDDRRQAVVLQMPAPRPQARPGLDAIGDAGV